MQFASLAISRELPIDSFKMVVRSHFQQDRPRYFRDMIFQIYLEGSPTLEQLEALAPDASSYCFAENTLGRGIPVTTEVYLNGKKVLESVKQPSDF